MINARHDREQQTANSELTGTLTLCLVVINHLLFGVVRDFASFLSNSPLRKQGKSLDDDAQLTRMVAGSPRHRDHRAPMARTRAQ